MASDCLAPAGAKTGDLYWFNHPRHGWAVMALETTPFIAWSSRTFRGRTGNWNPPGYLAKIGWSLVGPAIPPALPAATSSNAGTSLSQTGSVTGTKVLSAGATTTSTSATTSTPAPASPAPATSNTGGTTATTATSSANPSVS